ncbi:MAG: peptidylprolyl isomerase [Bacteroidetes bacterium GWA2_30_7]|nr:MAG: peptidylprolyl isomerase [Bacteroidetes bacterium GWA2_30_7]
MDSMSYSIGLQVGKNLKSQGPDTINVKAFVKAIEDFYADVPKISIEDANKIVENFFKKDLQKQYGEKKGLNEKFLADNKSKAGVVSLPSGLQYKIIKEGNGIKPTLNDVVKTHYTGTLVDGTKFDSSVDRNEPATFPVQGVIPGWTEALQLMPVGSKWELYIPYNLAYGERGYPPSIEPFSTLIFELELLSIEKEPAK